MADPRNYLRDRGLADDAPPAQPVPFRVNLDTGQIETTDPAATQLQGVGLPDDYAARLVAVEHGSRLLVAEGIEATMTAARRIHAFLIGAEPAPKEQLHTDE